MPLMQEQEIKEPRNQHTSADATQVWFIHVTHCAGLREPQLQSFLVTGLSNIALAFAILGVALVIFQGRNKVAIVRI